MQAGSTTIFNIFGMTGPSSNQESNPQILLVSAGVTEDLFVTRGLHQEPPPRTPTGYKKPSESPPSAKSDKPKARVREPLNVLLLF